MCWVVFLVFGSEKCRTGSGGERRSVTMQLIGVNGGRKGKGGQAEGCQQLVHFSLNDAQSNAWKRRKGQMNASIEVR